MSCLEQEREILSEKFNYHIEEFSKLNQHWFRWFPKLKRDTNKYYHLNSYRHLLYDKWLDMEDDSPEKPLIQKKLHDIGHLMARTKRNYKLLEFELDVNSYIEDIHQVAYNKYHDELEKTHFLTKKKCRITKVRKNKIQQLENEDCCICLSPHKIKDIVTTSCGHSFGKSCAESMLCKNNCNITCPLCRNTDIEFTIYRRA